MPADNETELTPEVVIHTVDAFYVWPGGRYVNVYVDPEQWAAGTTPEYSFEVESTTYDPDTLPGLVRKHLALRAAKGSA
jgi:hypothetical protein